MIDENILDDTSKVIDGSVVIGKHEATFLFKNKSTDELSERIYELLVKQGYKLEVGSKFNATYGKGSKIGRLLLGAFIKRFVFSVKIIKVEGATTLVFSKDGKGYMGGAIGVVQVKNEYNSIISILGEYHSKTTDG
jgi:hypothetical protein